MSYRITGYAGKWAILENEASLSAKRYKNKETAKCVVILLEKGNSLEEAHKKLGLTKNIAGL
jgi:hypothetical protein